MPTVSDHIESLTLDGDRQTLICSGEASITIDRESIIINGPEGAFASLDDGLRNLLKPGTRLELRLNRRYQTLDLVWRCNGHRSRIITLGSVNRRLLNDYDARDILKATNQMLKQHQYEPVPEDAA